MSADLRATTERFFEAWGTNWAGFVASFDLFADDCVWEQGPAITRTRDEAVALMTGAHESAGVERCVVEMRNIWVVGNTVITERVDHIHRGDGTIAASAPVVGLMWYDDGRIQRWHEYFDSASLASLTPGA